VSTRQRHNWFGKKDLDDFDGRPVIGIAVATMATTLWQRLFGSGSRGSRCLSLADYVMETGPRRGRPLPEGAKVGYPQAGEACMWVSVSCEDDRRFNTPRQGCAASRPWGPLSHALDQPPRRLGDG
jgi:hypothetical protein